VGGALEGGGPGSIVICFIIIGVMILMMMQALGELAVMYPINGAFYTYIVRFIDPSWGFAVGWEYAIQWLTILPFELTAAGLTIRFWNDTINVGVWITIFVSCTGFCVCGSGMLIQLFSSSSSFYPSSNASVYVGMVK